MTVPLLPSKRLVCQVCGIEGWERSIGCRLTLGPPVHCGVVMLPPDQLPAAEVAVTEPEGTP